ncbi:MAG: hypothetical protein RLN89_07870 [Parvibaculum sp.]
MRSPFWNFTAVAALLAMVVAFETGMMAPRDAFFAIFTLMTVYISALLIAHENESLGDALWSIFFKPGTNVPVMAYASNLVVAGLGTVVVVQTLTFA